MKLNPTVYSFLLIVGIVLCYLYFGYRLERDNFTVLLSLYSSLFLLSYFIYKTTASFKTLIGLAIVLRLLFLVSIPNLSQDFYRFIWDGRLLIQGINPYLKTPEQYITQGLYSVPQALELIKGMGALNASHFSNYPPLNQVCFAVAAFFSNSNILGSVVVLRMICILADIGIMVYGYKLLKQFKRPVNRLFLYALNPFIIIELVGNLHFEGVMIFFLLLSLYHLNKKSNGLAALSLAASILIKLLPLIFLPLLLFQQNLKKGILVVFLTGLFCAIGFAPFFSISFITNYTETIGLWFSNFEFNASIYYLIRELGFYITGYNIISLYGKLMATFFMVFVFFTAYKSRVKTNPSNLVPLILIVLSIYLFLSTTVHPWYIATLVALSVFTKFKFAFVWSFLIVLSYYAYSTANYTESKWLLFVQYVPVLLIFIWEVLSEKSRLVFKKTFIQ